MLLLTTCILAGLCLICLLWGLLLLYVLHGQLVEVLERVTALHERFAAVIERRERRQ